MRLLPALAVLLVFTLLGAAPAAAKASDAVCEVNGFVTAIEKVERSAWDDGAPSPFSTVETRITLKIAERMPRDKGVAGESCKKTGEDALVTYKLCSPTKVKVGDTILATEGIETGSAHALGCLFDVSVKQP